MRDDGEDNGDNDDLDGEVYVGDVMKLMSTKVGGQGHVVMIMLVMVLVLCASVFGAAALDTYTQRKQKHEGVRGRQRGGAPAHRRRGESGSKTATDGQAAGGVRAQRAQRSRGPTGTLGE